MSLICTTLNLQRNTYWYLVADGLENESESSMTGLLPTPVPHLVLVFTFHCDSKIGANPWRRDTKGRAGGINLRHRLLLCLPDIETVKYHRNKSHG